MGNIYISPRMKRIRTTIDLNGNEYDPITKELVSKAEPDYVPPVNVQPSQPQIEKNTEIKEEQKNSPLAEMIKKQVNEAVLNALKDINIQALVQKAIEDAFGGLK